MATSNGPVPTTLTLLSGLNTFSPGAKVRFLGCVSRYDIKAAILTLEHKHPPGQTLKARVSVNLLLNTLKSHETRVGEWVNVLGYIQAEFNPKDLVKPDSEVHIQALALWSTGPLDLQRYERSLDQQKAYADETPT